MTIKVPAARLKGEEAINRLHDLEFDEEFRRVKRFWADRIKAGGAPALPVAFSPPEQ